MSGSYLRDINNVVSASELSATVDAIAEWQLPSGMVPWFPGGHADPWNHVEAAMALDLGGRRADAERAYDWLVQAQRRDGAWHQYYLADSIEQDKLDANVCAYVAAGVWHHYLLTEDDGFVESMWPVVERAIDFVLELQRPRGEILWARHADGTPWSFALLTGSSSICHSLRCAIAIAEHLGHERPDWELSAGRLADVIAHQPEAFAPKHRWAMDWYYPVLTGMVAAWLAQLLDAEAACRIAVYLHGLAGDLAEADEGEVSMTSADVAGHLGDAMLELTARRKVGRTDSSNELS